MTLPKRLSNNVLPAYAWPGGYPIFYLDGNCSVLCADCATKAADTPDAGKDAPTVGYAHYEGPSEVCEGCNTEIESAYGDPDAVKEEN